MNKTQTFLFIAIFANTIYLLITFIFFYFLDNPVMSFENNDYKTFHDAGLIILEDLPDLYNPSLYLFPFRYFPLSAYFFIPFSLLGLKVGYFAF